MRPARPMRATGAPSAIGKNSHKAPLSLLWRCSQATFCSGQSGRSRRASGVGASRAGTRTMGFLCVLAHWAAR
eukprot:6350923-Pyramimonas_sp.AAC.1